LPKKDGFGTISEGKDQDGSPHPLAVSDETAL
jgi:hypothetical protein